MLKLRICLTFFILLLFVSVSMYGQIQIKEKVEVKENNILLKPPPMDDNPQEPASDSMALPFAYCRVELTISPVEASTWNRPPVEVFYSIGNYSGTFHTEALICGGSNGGGGLVGSKTKTFIVYAGSGGISIQMFGCCNSSKVGLGPTIVPVSSTADIQSYKLQVPLCGRPGLTANYGSIIITDLTPPPPLPPCWKDAPICEGPDFIPPIFIPKAYRNQPSFDLTADVCSGVQLADGSIRIGGFMKISKGTDAAEPITRVDYCYDKLADRWRFKVNNGIFEPRVVIDICESVLQNKGYVLLNSPADLDLLQFPCDALKDIEGHANYPITSKKFVIKDLLWAHEENHNMLYRDLFEIHRAELTKLMTKVEKSCEDISYTEMQKGSFSGDVKVAYARYLDFVYNEHEKLKVVQRPDGTLVENPNYEINTHSSPYVQGKKQKYIDYLKIKYNCR